MKYLLDTNIISFHLKENNSIKQKLLALDHQDIAISSISIAISNRLILATTDSDYERIKALRSENWLD